MAPRKIVRLELAGSSRLLGDRDVLMAGDELAHPGETPGDGEPDRVEAMEDVVGGVLVRTRLGRLVMVSDRLVRAIELGETPGDSGGVPDPVPREKVGII